MGTNYYLHEAKPCPTCGHSNPPRHIGKSSAGWVFMLHVYPEEGINTYEDWYERWTRQGAVIMDEYGVNQIPLQFMVKTVTARAGTLRSTSHRPEGQTYEYVDVEFS